MKKYVLAVFLVCIFIGRSFGDDFPRTLELSGAIKALENLILESKNDFLADHKDRLKELPNQKAKNGELDAGPWSVNLRSKNFVFALIKPPVLLQYTGDFVYEEKKKEWKAVIKGRTHAH